MDYNQAVPNDGCQWLLSEQQESEIQNEEVSMGMFKDIGDDVKSRIDEELTIFRSRIHQVVEEQRTNMAYMFGIPHMQHEDFQDCHEVADAMIGLENEVQSNSSSNHYSANYTSHTAYTGINSSGEEQTNEEMLNNCHVMNQYGSDSVMSNVDLVLTEDSPVNHSSANCGKTKEEELKNNCVMRILAATLRINNALANS